MLIETLIFITIAFAIFIYMFYQLIKKNDTKYVPILAIEALGIGIEFIQVYFSDGKINIFVEIISYILSIILPIAVIILEKANSNVQETLYTALARICLLFGNTKKAKNFLIELVTINPNSYIGHKLLAQIYEKEGGQRKAVDEYAQAIEINKQDYDSCFKVSELLIDLDKKDEAEEVLINLISKKPDYIEATIALGDLLIEKEDYKEAANVYVEALKINPTSFELNYNLGIVYTMLNDFASAKLCYEKAAEINTLIYNTKYSLAEIAMMYKDLDEAERYFMEVTEDEELSADAYLELSKIYLIKGDKDRAIQYANVAIQESPKKIVEKIHKDPLFAIIIAKLSIPFNLEAEEQEEEKQHKLTPKEIKAKEHLEEMVEITKKIGYNDLKLPKKQTPSIDEVESNIEKHKEREE